MSGAGIFKKKPKQATGDPFDQATAGLIGPAIIGDVDKKTKTDSTQPGLQTSPQTPGGTEWDPNALETGGRLARAGRNLATWERNQTQIMPVMDSEEVKRVRRRYTAQQMGRGGRESTALTSDKLGAG